MGTAAEELSMVDRSIMGNGPKLNPTQQRLLIAACTAKEVEHALFSMDSNKAHGLDVYNAYFFKRCWPILGKEVIQAVQQFFATGELPQEVNQALLVLLPKYENASCVKEYRPIACCTVLYKTISKVLANRMQLVLDTVISDNQSTFVKGRLIQDNIILSHELIKGYQRKHISPRCMIKVDIHKAYDSVE